MKTSVFGSINFADLGKGLLIAVGTVVLTGVTSYLQSGKFPTMAQLAVIGTTALAAGVTYLLKNLFTNSSNTLGTPEPTVPVTTVTTPATTVTVPSATPTV